MDILDYALEETLKYVKELKIQEYFSTIYHQHLHLAAYAREEFTYEEEYLAYAKDCLAYNLMPRPVDDIFTEQYFRKRALFHRVYKKAKNEKEKLKDELNIFKDALNYVFKEDEELYSLFQQQIGVLERKTKSQETIVRWLSEKNEQFELVMKRVAASQLKEQIERFYLQKVHEGLRKLFGKTQVKLYLSHYTYPSFKYSVFFSFTTIEKYLQELTQNIRQHFNFFIYEGDGYFNINLYSEKFGKTSLFPYPTPLQRRFNDAQEKVDKLKDFNYLEQRLKDVREEKKKEILAYFKRERKGLNEEEEKAKLDQLEVLCLEKRREETKPNEDVFQEIRNMFGDNLIWTYECVPVLLRSGEFNIQLYSISSANGEYTLQLKEKPKKKSKKLSQFWKRKG